MKRRKRPRWVQRIKAFALGYFWMPCPMCGHHFGGHEENGGALWLWGDMGQLVCSECDPSKLNESLRRAA